MKKFLVILTFCATGALALEAGPWPQPRGHGFFKLGEWWMIADKHFTDAGKIDPNVTNGVFTTSMYAEYGLTDRLTGIVYFPFFSRSLYYNTVSGTTGEVLIPGEAVNGLGDTDISLSYGLITNAQIVMSAALVLGLPTGISDGGTQGNLQTGDGEFNQMLRIDVGTGFKLGNSPGYASAYIAYNNRTQGFSDEMRAGVEAGVTVFDGHLTALMRLYTVQSTFNGDLDDTSSGTSLFANNAEHVSYSPEIAWNFNERWGLSASYAGAISGRLIFANPAFSVGVFMKL